MKKLDSRIKDLRKEIAILNRQLKKEKKECFNHIMTIKAMQENHLFFKAKIYRTFIKDIITKIFTPRELAVIIYRWGFDDNMARSLEETGRKFGVPRERIRNIEATALEKIYSIQVDNVYLMRIRK